MKYTRFEGKENEWLNARGEVPRFCCLNTARVRCAPCVCVCVRLYMDLVRATTWLNETFSLKTYIIRNVISEGKFITFCFIANLEWKNVGWWPWMGTQNGSLFVASTNRPNPSQTITTSTKHTDEIIVSASCTVSTKNKTNMRCEMRESVLSWIYLQVIIAHSSPRYKEM